MPNPMCGPDGPKEVMMPWWMKLSRRFPIGRNGDLFAAVRFFDKEGEGEGEGGAGGGSGGGGIKKEEKPADTVSRATLDEAIRERDKAKQVNRTLMDALGLETEWIDDEEKPGRRKPNIKGLDRIKTLMQKQSDDEEETQKKKGDWDSKKRQLTDQHNQQLTAVKTTHKRQIDARDGFIKRLAVVEPIRQACVAEHAVDDDSGKFEDIVALLSPRIKVEIDEDDETGDIAVKVQPIGDDGKVMTNKKTGEPLTIQEVVAEFLTKRPKFRQSRFARGAGTGNWNGNGSNGRAVGGNGNHAEEAADELFGVTAKN